VKGASGTFFSTLGRQDFRIVDAYTDLTFQVPNFITHQGKLPLKFFSQADWNCIGNNAPSPWAHEDFAFIAGATLGQNKKKGDWQIGYDYRFVEANSIVGAFSDSAFGGTDREGHNLTFKYSILDNVTAGIRYVYYDRIINFDWASPTNNNIQPDRHMIRFEVQVNF
jgi:hypothetical protein